MGIAWGVLHRAHALEVELQLREGFSGGGVGAAGGFVGGDAGIFGGFDGTFGG